MVEKGKLSLIDLLYHGLTIQLFIAVIKRLHRQAIRDKLDRHLHLTLIPIPCRESPAIAAELKAIPPPYVISLGCTKPPEVGGAHANQGWIFTA